MNPYLQDFDNDGWQELLVTADYGDSKMFWNTQQYNFTECTQFCGIKAKQVKHFGAQNEFWKCKLWKSFAKRLPSTILHEFIRKKNP